LLKGVQLVAPNCECYGGIAIPEVGSIGIHIYYVAMETADSMYTPYQIHECCNGLHYLFSFYPAMSNNGQQVYVTTWLG